MAEVKNLGRIQGGGFFFSTDTSGDTIERASVVPNNIQALVGDHIVFSNGDVRRVVSGTKTNLTLTYVTTIKGEKGDTPSTEQFLQKSGGTMTGPITISGGDGKGILFKDKTSDIDILDNGILKTLLGFYQNEFCLSHSTFNTHIRGSKLDIKSNGNSGINIEGVSANTDYSTIHTNTNNRALFLQEENFGIVNIGGTPSKTEAQDMSAKLIVNGDIKEGTQKLIDKYQPKGNYLTEHQDISGKADKTYVDKKVAEIVNSAPEALDTLNELAIALGNDPNFATTMATNIGKKVSKSGISHILYGTNSQGAEYNWNIIKEETLPTQDSAGNANVNGIPKYNYTHGTLSTNTPINDRDATNKKYVDEELSKKQNKIKGYYINDNGELIIKD